MYWMRGTRCLFVVLFGLKLFGWFELSIDVTANKSMLFAPTKFDLDRLNKSLRNPANYAQHNTQLAYRRSMNSRKPRLIVNYCSFARHRKRSRNLRSLQK
jgi:hypothetical protein